MWGIKSSFEYGFGQAYPLIAKSLPLAIEIALETIVN